METLCDVLPNGWTKNPLDAFICQNENMTVPNHLLDTKIFNKLRQNTSVKVDPDTVHFAGYRLNQKHSRRIRICNSSSDRQNLHIIPPDTKHFSIKYTKPRRFVPGFTIDVNITFVTDEWKYHYDCIRLHCEDSDSIIIPIHAYPIMDLSSIPRKVVFQPSTVSLGKSERRLLPLRSFCPVDFEFHITVAQSHPALKVQPLSGTVPGEGQTDIVIIYTPTEYVTSHMTLVINISQFNSKPVTCFVTASCSPKTDATQHLSIKDSDDMYQQTKLLDPVSLSLLTISRKRKGRSETIADPKEENVLAIPMQHKVNMLLMQEAGKSRTKDLKDAVSQQDTLAEAGSTTGMMKKPSRQMKEAKFKRKTRQTEIDERANHLRWQKHLGYEELTEEAQVNILRERQAADEVYKLDKRLEPVEEFELSRNTLDTALRRVFRSVECSYNSLPNFDLYRNNAWTNRHHALDRFQQAARKVLIQRRADKKVVMLRSMVGRARAGSLTVDRSLERTDELRLDVRPQTTPGTSSHIQPDFSMVVGKVKQFTFPVFYSLSQGIDIAGGEQTEVKNETTKILLHDEAPFLNLKVPNMYNICSYGVDDIQDVSHNYVLPSLPRSLRTGAEDELIEAHLYESQKLPSGDNIGSSDSLADEKLDGPSNAVDKADRTSAVIMPINILYGPRYHDLHLFNLYPGIQNVNPLFKRSEADADYHLCPVPGYPRAGNNRFHEGKMAWKSSPHPACHMDFVEGVIPRWSDSFTGMMIPVFTPRLLPPPEVITASSSSELLVDLAGIDVLQDEEGEFVQERRDDQKPAGHAVSGADQVGSTIEKKFRKLAEMDKGLDL